jgi:hypothetical protein
LQQNRPRLCENASFQRPLRIIFCVVHLRPMLKALLFFMSPKSRLKFYFSKERRSFAQPRPRLAASSCSCSKPPHQRPMLEGKPAARTRSRRSYPSPIDLRLTMRAHGRRQVRALGMRPFDSTIVWHANVVTRASGANRGPTADDNRCFGCGGLCR